MTKCTVLNPKTSVKLHIPHAAESKGVIVGILEQISNETPFPGRKLALILHGTMGHKDYLFQKQLASRLPMDTFRFDFRGNHESTGKWNFGALEEDVADISVVVDYLKQAYGYKVDLLIGHSRGSLAAMRWICTTEDGKYISGFVNISARYRMYMALDHKERQKSFSEKGYHDWTVTVAGKSVSVKIFREDLERFSQWDTSVVWDRFPNAADVLVLHGLSDDQVPPYDATIYAHAFENRSPGTVVLNFIEGANHNYLNKRDEVVDVVLKWWISRERGDLRSGVWSNEEEEKLRRSRM